MGYQPGYSGPSKTWSHAPVPMANEQTEPGLPSLTPGSLDSTTSVLLTQHRIMTESHNRRVNGLLEAPRVSYQSGPTGKANSATGSSHAHHNMHVPVTEPMARAAHPSLQIEPHRNLRGPAGPGYSYTHAPKTRFGNQQSNPARRKQIQTNYMDCLAARIPLHGPLDDRSKDKKTLQALLARISREAVKQHARDHGLEIPDEAVSLQCFGSSRNGFSLPGADLDLLFSMHMDPTIAKLEAECPRILQDAFELAGFHSSLITKARVPIIKICGVTTQLLHSLKSKIQKEDPSLGCANSAVDQDPYSGPHSPAQFASDHDLAIPGAMQCDINFSGHLALYNTELLRSYALCDERVRAVGIFVKMWAKARKINTPYHGTLCSYGYILMVIHYLMNIVYPPLVPNLQLMYHSSERRDTTSINQHGLGFFSNEAKLKGKAWIDPRYVNQQSIGELLRGFFAYYGSRGTYAPRGGFDWVRDVISIRTLGGLLSKDEKGWTAAQTDESGHRLRFLLGVEDPFEHHHNVGRTVTLNGVKKIRAEFQREKPQCAATP
ncbi:predicted protein [Aspergillus terreus NIH2624]|uniref:polynucleotide adenylyltransferase n=1 Tax=Aspergillus terreus (strain NIH 2624 / FGSC A1156) TaxID=341663 RepID=Q0CPX8_ASPTN|nr:uncharacterized protein ATEG_04256 [Aspergillus terreus NIH2624]EAU34703.1 predicted protein [Aspergillus terreus NIH2624]